MVGLELELQYCSAFTALSLVSFSGCSALLFLSLSIFCLQQKLKIGAKG